MINAIFMPFVWKEHVDVELGTKAMALNVEEVS